MASTRLTATAAHAKRPAEHKPAHETSGGCDHCEQDATLCKRPRLDEHDFRTTAATTAPKDAEPSRQASVAAPSTPELKPAPAPAFAPPSLQNVLVARLKQHSAELLRMNEIARERLRRVAEKTRQLNQVRRHVSAAVGALRRREAANRANGVTINPFSWDGGDKSGVVDGAIDASARLRNPRADLRDARGSAFLDEDEADSGERGRSAGPAAPAAPAVHTAGDEEDEWAKAEDDTRGTTGASSSSDSTGSVTGPRRLDHSTNGGSVSLLEMARVAAARGGGSPAGRCGYDLRDGDGGAWTGARQRSVGGADMRVRVAEGGGPRGARCSWLQC